MAQVDEENTAWLERVISQHGKTALVPLDDPQQVNQYRGVLELNPLDEEDIAAAWPTYPER